MREVGGEDWVERKRWVESRVSVLLLGRESIEAH